MSNDLQPGQKQQQQLQQLAQNQQLQQLAQNQQQLQQSPQWPELQQLNVDQMDQCIHWLKLATQPMGLRGFTKMVTGIDQLPHTQLTAWTAAFTSKLLAALKHCMKPHSKGNSHKALLVSSMSDFTRFKAVYDAFQQEVLMNASTENDKQFLAAFFEFCSAYTFVLTTDVDAVERELNIAEKEKWWVAQSKFFQAVVELTSSGVQQKDLVDVLKTMAGVDFKHARQVTEGNSEQK
ncbi:Hypothetical protein, putative [Bodo saltans]|uniref:Uncharacterized protein n=1 Tax=Bodo saltans TaxID=75058 RepID=A0A0S4IUI1_BODSA|nr:Hypothetical protein, putative [Bodo saltans]|eukprot:CUG10879.1 Hypothetical protein, putative [Bodo saltans]